MMYPVRSNQPSCLKKRARKIQKIFKIPPKLALKLLVNKLFCIFVLFIISACGTTTHLKILRNGGVFKEEVSNEAGYDYKVFIRNASDFGWNGDRREDREKAVNLLFEDRCKKTEIIEDLPLQTGTYPINRPAITWIMKIKCNK